MKKLISSIGPSLKTRVAQAIINGNITGHEAPVQQMIDRVLHNSQRWSKVINCHVGSEAEVREVDEIEQLFTPEAVAMCSTQYTDVRMDPWFQGKALGDEILSTLNSIPDSWYRRAYYSVTRLKNHNIRGSNGKSLVHILSTYPEGFESKILYIKRLFFECLIHTGMLINLRCSKGFLPAHYLHQSIHKAMSDSDKELYEEMQSEVRYCLPEKQLDVKFSPPIMQFDNRLHQAVINHDLEAVISIFDGENPADINGVDENCETPLFTACSQESSEFVQLFLGLYADPNIAALFGITCLYSVTSSALIPHALLAAGARPAFPPYIMERNPHHLTALNLMRGCIGYKSCNPIAYLTAGDELVSERVWRAGNYGYGITFHTNLGDMQKDDPRLSTRGTIVKGVKIVPPQVSERWKIFNEALQDSFSSIRDISKIETCPEERMRIFLFGWAAIDINKRYPHLATINSRTERIKLYAIRHEAINNRYRELYFQFVVPNRAHIYANDSFSGEEKQSIARQCTSLIKDPVIRFRRRWRATYSTQASRAARIESLK